MAEMCSKAQKPNMPVVPCVPPPPEAAAAGLHVTASGYLEHIQKMAPAYAAASKEGRTLILNEMTNVYLGELSSKGTILNEGKTRTKICKDLHRNKTDKEAKRKKRMERINRSYVIAEKAKQEGKTTQAIAAEAQQVGSGVDFELLSNPLTAIH